MTKFETECIKKWLHNVSHGKIEMVDFYSLVYGLVYPPVKKKYKEWKPKDK